VPRGCRTSKGKRKGDSQEQSKLKANLLQFSGSLFSLPFSFPLAFVLSSHFHSLASDLKTFMPVSSCRKARILLYFPPVVRSRGNIHSHSLNKLFVMGEVFYYGQSPRTRNQVGILRHVVRRPSPHHFATSISRSRFLSAAMEDRSS
jgi:hypothetical protein